MTHSKKGRRRLLKTLGAGGGIVLAGKSLPTEWARPVVETVLLPSHAQTSTLTSGSSDASIECGLQLVEIITDPSVVEQGDSFLLEVVYDIIDDCTCLNLTHEIETFLGSPVTTLTRNNIPGPGSPPDKYKESIVMTMDNYPLTGGLWPATLYTIHTTLACEDQIFAERAVQFRVISP